MGQYLGLVGLGTALRSSTVTRNAAGTPVDASSAPAYRVYGPAGVMSNGTLLSKDPSSSGGTITNATNATPIVVSSTAHGLTTGTRVTISGVTGNTAANADWTVTVIDANTFSLNSSVGNGAYVSGGTWHVAGLYDINVTPQGADGYVQGQNYAMLVTYVVAGVTQADVHTFTVI